MTGTASVDRVTKKRFTKSEAREALVEYGSAELSAAGVTVVPTGLSLEDACAATGVPRSSGYAVFSEGDIRPADAYSAAVISHVTQDIEEQNKAVIALSTHLLDLGVPVKEMVRQIGNAVYTAMPTGWIIDVAVRCSVAVGNNDHLRATVDQLDAVFAQGIIDSVYRVIVERYGMQVKPCYGERGIETFAIMNAGLIEGWNLRTVGTRFSDLTEIIILKDSNGADVEWSPLSMASWALVREFFDLTDD